ncbi:MAG: LysR family transcriptional regulator [Neisseriaceae bacterium]|nr:LysR family transcriptional regulator [Neisseriaceae bacterium]
MNLKQLTYVLAVAETKNFTRAAAQCHVVQSALSHQIAKLEEELGQPLFIRNQRQVSLTQAGLAIIEPAKAMLAAKQALIDAVHASQDEVAGLLALGTISTLNSLDLVTVLSQFHAQHPKVSNRLHMGMSGQLLDDLRQQKADIVFIGVPPGDQSMMPWPHQLLGTEELVAIMAPNHPLAQKTTLSLASLSQQPLVDYPLGSSARRQTDQAFEKAGLKRQVHFEIDHIDWLTQAVANQLALGMVPLSTAQTLTGLVYRPILEAPQRQTYAVWQPNPSPAAQRFLALLPRDNATL